MGPLRGEPKAILPASQMVKVPVPGYVIEDPTLAAVVDEQHADRPCQALAGSHVGDYLPHTATASPIADPDDIALEVAALMTQVRSPLLSTAPPATSQAKRPEPRGLPCCGPAARKRENTRKPASSPPHLFQALQRAHVIRHRPP
ncbi:hypothetical protein AB0N99_25510 [Streptomyces sp. NPDC093272]|uniref:hypothetical protein n=1 Tax=Streptomyces sp. NPDC093272 TaxID=3154981 RepID=UPI0034143658